MKNITQKLRRLTTLTVATLFAQLTFAGTFTDITCDETPSGEKWVSYTGTIEDSDIKQYEAFLQEKKTLILVIESGGGSFHAGVKLGKLTRKYRDKVTIYIDKAYSAAALWTIGDDDYQWLDEDAELGFHLPYYYGNDAGAGADQAIGYTMGRYLEDIYGKEDAETFMLALASVRDEYGKFALLCYAPGKDPFIKE